MSKGTTIAVSVITSGTNIYSSSILDLNGFFVDIRIFSQEICIKVLDDIKR